MTATLHAGLELRGYQHDALAAIHDAEARGVRRQMLVAATGLGKTVIFVALAQARGGRTLILAHRDELIAQAAAKVSEVWPDADVGVVKAERDEWERQVVVASVQTLGRPARLKRITDELSGMGGLLGNRLEPFTLVVVDEAHHTAAESYQRILEALRAGEDDGPLLLGVTATPQRGDGKGLDKLYSEVVYTRDMLWGIRNGYLSDLRGLRVKLDVDLSRLRTSHGDYDQGQAGELLSSAGAPELIAQAWKRHAAGRRTLVFTPTVALAQDVADAFARHGVAASYVSGETPLDERRYLLEQFSLGKLDVMANCAVLTEGYDEPRVDCVVVARPTKSQALYVQMVGRGTRRHPDKTDCLVLDVAGASDVHSLITLPSLFGLDDASRKRMEREGVGASQALADQMDAAARSGRIKAEEAELFRQVRAGMAWVAIHRPGDLVKSYALAGTSRQRLQLQGSGDQFTLTLVRTDHSERVLVSGVSLELAQGVGEDYVRKHGAPHAVQVADVNAAWRKRSPTAKQRAAAAKWRVTITPGMTAGDVADALTARIAKWEAKKHRDQQAASG